MKDKLFLILGFIFLLFFPLLFWEFLSLAQHGGIVHDKFGHAHYDKPGEWYNWLMVILAFFPALVSTVILCMAVIAVIFKSFNIVFINILRLIRFVKKKSTP